MSKVLVNKSPSQESTLNWTEINQNFQCVVVTNCVGLNREYFFSPVLSDEKVRHRYFSICIFLEISYLEYNFLLDILLSKKKELSIFV